MQTIGEHLYNYIFDNELDYSEAWDIIESYSHSIADDETMEGKQVISFTQDQSTLSFYGYEEKFSHI